MTVSHPALYSAQPGYGSHGVTWTPPGSEIYAPPPMPNASNRSVRTSAIVVIVLTLACTLLSIYDLFLLAIGSA